MTDAAAPGPGAPSPSLSYRPDIDGLRAVAVLAVIVYHAFPSALRGGFVGVDIFFVISGFLISTIVFTQLDAGRYSIADFYRRRIRRIFPALIVVLATALAFGWFAMLSEQFRELGKHVAGGMGFVANFVLWNESGYFDGAAHGKPLLHLWSLGIEEQFYIFWPLLAWAAWKIRGGVVVLLAALLLGSFALNVATVGTDPVAAFYSPLSRAWELTVGSLLAWLVLRRHVTPDRLGPGAANALSVAGVALLVLSIVAIDADDAFPGWWAALPVLGTAAAIAAGPGALLNRRLLGCRPAVWIGLISYPLYLWHWPLLFALRVFDGPEPSLLARAMVVLASVVLAALTYVFVESRIRHRRGAATVVMLLVAGLVTGGAGALVWQAGGVPDRAVVRDSGLSPAAEAQFTGPHWQYMRNDTCRQRYPYALEGDLAWWFCYQGDARPPTLALLGNSFANQLYPGFAANPRLRHHSILSIGACEIGGVLENYAAPRQSPCYGRRAAAEKKFIDSLVAREKSIRFVILAGHANMPPPDYVRRVVQRIGHYRRHGVQVVMVTPHLRIPFHPRECFDGPGGASAKDCTVPASVRAKALADFQPMIDAVARAYPEVRFFDPNGVFCRGGDTCSFVHDGMPLHRDASPHLSEYGSVLLQDEFTAWARRNIPEILDEDALATPRRRER